MFCASVLATLWKAAVMMLMLTGARTVMATDYLAEILVLTGAVALPPVGAVAPLKLLLFRGCTRRSFRDCRLCWASFPAPMTAAFWLPISRSSSQPRL